jgi:hypothetical protein
VSSIAKFSQSGIAGEQHNEELIMAKGNRSQKREVRKPKKEKPKAEPATARRN